MLWKSCRCAVLRRDVLTLVLHRGWVCFRAAFFFFLFFFFCIPVHCPALSGTIIDHHWRFFTKAHQNHLAVTIFACQLTQLHPKQEAAQQKCCAWLRATCVAAGLQAQNQGRAVVVLCSPGLPLLASFQSAWEEPPFCTSSAKFGQHWVEGSNLWHTETAGTID